MFSLVSDFFLLNIMFVRFMHIVAIVSVLKKVSDVYISVFGDNIFSILRLRYIWSASKFELWWTFLYVFLLCIYKHFYWVYT